MSKMIFVNLPVKDLAASVRFYEAIGCKTNQQFSNEQAAMMVWSDTISFMLLTHGFFSGFTPKPIADACAATEVLLCLSSESRESVDAMVAQAGEAGGRPDPGPQQDYGFMYGRSFEDPDGHHWEVMWIDLEAAKAAMAPAAEPLPA